MIDAQGKMEIQYDPDKYFYIFSNGFELWACAEYDHGPLCRRCFRLTEVVSMMKDKLRFNEENLLSLDRERMGL